MWSFLFFCLKWILGATEGENGIKWQLLGCLEAHLYQGVGAYLTVDNIKEMHQHQKLFYKKKKKKKTKKKKKHIKKKKKKKKKKKQPKCALSPKQLQTLPYMFWVKESQDSEEVMEVR